MKTNGQNTRPKQRRKIAMIDGVGDIETIMNNMTVIGLR